MISSVQAINTVGSFLSLQGFNGEVKVFIEEAEKEFERAANEVNLANSVRSSVARISSTKNNNLRLIAIWHYENGVKKFIQAIKNLEQAIYFHPEPKHQQFINLKMKEYLKNKKQALAYKQKIECSVHN